MVIGCRSTSNAVRSMTVGEQSGEMVRAAVGGTVPDVPNDARLMNSIDSDTVSGICPTFFRACIVEARRGSYASPGYHLAIHVRRLVDVNDETLDELDAVAAADDPEALLDWLDRVVPRCMALVPRRRRRTFLRGLALALDHDRV